MILVTGGTGFVGRNIVLKLVEKNLPTRVLVRRKTYQDQFKTFPVEIAWGDITDKASLREALHKIDTVIHCVGILVEKGKSVTHQKIVIEGTRNLLEACKENRVKKIIYLSGLGTSEKARSRYHKAKWMAETMIRQSGLEYAIFRPSVIFGKADDFLNKFMKMAEYLPFLPILGDGKYVLQPVSIHNVVSCVVQSLQGETAKNKVFEIGGPQRLSFNEIMDMMLRASHIKRWKLHIPMGIAGVAAQFFEILPNPPFTRDQLLMLEESNVTDNKDLNKAFQMSLIPLSEGLKEYSWYK